MMARLLRKSVATEEGNQAAQIWASHALLQAERADITLGQAKCHSLLADLYQRLGFVDRSSDHRTKALALFRRLGDRRSQAECLMAVVVDARNDAPELRQEAAGLAEEIRWGGSATGGPYSE